VKLGLKLEIGMREADSLEGIIAYLTKKHEGNVHEKGIITITSKSVSDDPTEALPRVADLTSRKCAGSTPDEPGQWLCWDFREMRVRPAHYTMRAVNLKSWVLEASLDAENWWEIDRKANSQVFKVGFSEAASWRTVSFAVSKSAECRFIRLTPTDKNTWGTNELCLMAVEFFETLSE
jgi:hypothetical protein